MGLLNTLQCTEEAAETDPSVVMRNVRQFVNGIKNYLVRNGEQGRLTEIIDEERERVSAVWRDDNSLSFRFAKIGQQELVI